MGEDHDNAYKAWRDQNELDAKIKWMRREKHKLQRKKEEEDYYKNLENEREAQLAEIKEQEKLYGKIRKFQPQIDVCDNIMKFLAALHPKVKEEENNTTETGGYDADEVNNKLASGEWKKEKVHILSKKRDDDEGVQPGQGKKKRNKGNKKGKENTEEAKLTLTIDTLNFFDSIKVTPPMYAKDIDETIAKVDEKKAYFIKISDE